MLLTELLKWFNTYVLMSEMFQQLQFTICTFGEDWGAKRFHNLLDRDILVCELISCGTRCRRISLTCAVFTPRRRFEFQG